MEADGRLDRLGARQRFHSAADQAPGQKDDQRRHQDRASGCDQRLPAPPLGQIEGAQVEDERQQRQHVAEVSERADQVLESAQLTGLHQDELAGVLHDLAAEQGGDPCLERGERGVEVLDVRLAWILEHGGGLLLPCG